MSGFDPGDQTDTNEHDQAEEDLERSDTAAVEKRFGKCGEERKRRETRQRDGYVGDFDRTEETEPMKADDSADKK